MRQYISSLRGYVADAYTTMERETATAAIGRPEGLLSGACQIDTG